MEDFSLKIQPIRHTHNNELVIFLIMILLVDCQPIFAAVDGVNFSMLEIKSMQICFTVSIAINSGKCAEFGSSLREYDKKGSRRRFVNVSVTV